MHMCAHVQVCTFVLYMCVFCVYVCICLRICICVYMYTYECMCVCACVHMNVCVYVCANMCEHVWVCSKCMWLLFTTRHNACSSRRPVSIVKGNQERRKGVRKGGKDKQDERTFQRQLKCREVEIWIQACIHTGRDPLIIKNCVDLFLASIITR